MNYQGIIKTFEPLSKESSLAVIDKLKKAKKLLNRRQKPRGFPLIRRKLFLMS